MHPGVIIGLIAVALVVIAVIYYVMNKSEPLPTWAPDGAVVRCPVDGGVYKISDGKKRYFSYEAWGAVGYPDAKDVDCMALAAMPTGSPM
jgi:hypothetical protein